jgi:hypothetical protein
MRERFVDAQKHLRRKGRKTRSLEDRHLAEMLMEVTQG